jgi:DNA helicase-2/ATP-dependent DNA helicase PcrA
MTTSTAVAGNDLDDHVDDEISACLKLDKPISFFLFAGAGSGKTRSLINALNRLREQSGRHLRLRGQKIGVITYTNAACDEIKRRLDFDPLVEIATIHSFIWSLIGGLNADIKQWVRENLKNEIAELKELQRKGKAGKASSDRERSIEAKEKRLAGLDSIKVFTYNPNGENRGQDSLNHSEVIKIGAEFLIGRPLMQRILVSKFPVLLIDESQDTNKLLMEAFLKVQQQQAKIFSLGLLGDTMQRIYGDGKADLGVALPADWATPIKKLNHRCPRRIVKLINKIRAAVDDHEQQPRTDKEEGFVRLFILPTSTADKPGAERKVAKQMAIITGDSLWDDFETGVKTLILEHHMAARRMGFLDMFEALSAEDSLRIGLLDGSLPGLRLFSQFVLPLMEAKKRGDEFSAMAIVRKNSPLLSSAVLRAAGSDQPGQIKKARDAVGKLMALWAGGNEPRFLDVLRCIRQTGLFEIPESLRPIASRSESEQQLSEEAVKSSASEVELSDPRSEAWERFLLTPFAQIEPYALYVNGEAAFDTHQGVKGLEFPRVMVLIDDTEARGFLFSYEKLFGAKEKSKTDLENEREGNGSRSHATAILYDMQPGQEKSGDRCLFRRPAESSRSRSERWLVRKW